MMGSDQDDIQGIWLAYDLMTSMGHSINVDSWLSSRALTSASILRISLSKEPFMNQVSNRLFAK